MVSSIIPGSQLPGTNAAQGVDPRLNRPAPANGAQTQSNANAIKRDQVALGDVATWAAARESVGVGLAQIGAALEIGREAQTLLGRIDELAREYSDDQEAAEAELADALKAFVERVQTAVESGVRLLRGDQIAVQAEPGAPPIAVEGLDLRPAGVGGENRVFAFSFDAQFDGDPSKLAAAADQSRLALDAGLRRLEESVRALEAHQGFLGALAGAANGVRADLDADAARLLALQVSQELSGLNGGAIANVEPRAVLNLFRA